MTISRRPGFLFANPLAHPLLFANSVQTKFIIIPQIFDKWGIVYYNNSTMEKEKNLKNQGSPFDIFLEDWENRKTEPPDPPIAKELNNFLAACWVESKKKKLIKNRRLK